MADSLINKLLKRSLRNTLQTDNDNNIEEISSLSKEQKQKFMAFYFYIEDKNISKDDKIKIEIKYLTLINKINIDFLTLDNDQAYLLVFMVLNINTNYNKYGEILGNKRILKSIIAKAPNFDTQVALFSQIIPECSINDNNLSNEQYEKHIKRMLEIINNYEIPKYYKKVIL